MFITIINIFIHDFFFAFLQINKYHDTHIFYIHDVNIVSSVTEHCKFCDGNNSTFLIINGALSEVDSGFSGGEVWGWVNI